MKSQQYGCFIKMCIMTTPANIPCDWKVFHKFVKNYRESIVSKRGKGSVFFRNEPMIGYPILSGQP